MAKGDKFLKNLISDADEAKEAREEKTKAKTPAASERKTEKRKFLVTFTDDELQSLKRYALDHRTSAAEVVRQALRKMKVI